MIRRDLFLAPGERIEIWVDFSDRPVGYETAMISLPFDAGGMSGTRMERGMMRGGGSGTDSSFPIGSNFLVFKVKITKAVKKNRPLPQQLSMIDPLEPHKAENFDDYPGLFLYHCHNLEHEDMGMMRNYYVPR